MTDISVIRNRAYRQAAPLIENLYSRGYKLVYMCLSGSHAHGTATPLSDIDVRAVVVRPKLHILAGIDEESFADNNSDTAAYTLDKFARMLANGNPNIVDMVGVRKEHVLVGADTINMLLDNLPMFMTKRVGAAYAGFAKSESKRILAMDGVPSSREKLCKAMMHYIRILHAGEHVLMFGMPRTYEYDLNEQRLLQDIRHGAYVDENSAVKSEYINLAGDRLKRLLEAKEHSKLPKEADMNKVNSLIASINARVLGLDWDSLSDSQFR